ncbi:MAG: hypothetical protein KAJ42_18700, partial [Gemmatimonadetes bacterium]|nr:hypothetical protein [Gemmatimonadota bacterium]
MRIPFSTRSPYTGGKNPVRRALPSGRLVALGGLVLLVAWPKGVMAADHLPTQAGALAAPVDPADTLLVWGWGSPRGPGHDRPLRLGLARLALPWPTLLPTAPITLSVRPDAASSPPTWALPRSSAEDGTVAQALETFANLDMTLRGRAELGGDWT